MHGSHTAHQLQCMALASRAGPESMLCCVVHDAHQPGALVTRLNLRHLPIDPDACRNWAATAVLLQPSPIAHVHSH
jgi:predicted HD phosphohydrolase